MATNVILTLRLTADEYAALVARVHDHNAEMRTDCALEGIEPIHRDQTPESFALDVLRDELGLDALEQPAVRS